MDCVPQSIWEVFNRAVKLYAYGYQEWEFFTMAQHYALLALEASLRALFAATLESPVSMVVVDCKQKVIGDANFADPPSYHTLWEAGRVLLKTHGRLHRLRING